MASLEVLEEHLFLAHIPPPSISLCFRVILKATMFSEREFSGRESFFSVTSAQDDPGLSLVIDETLLQSLPIQNIVIGPKLRAIKVHEGSDAINSIGYIQALASPLAKLGINPIYLSTYGSDILLVHPDDLLIALRSLEQVIGTGSQWEEIISSSDHETPTPSNCTMAVSCFREELSLFTLNTHNIAESALEILSLFVYPTIKECQFLSYTVTADEISVLVNTTAAEGLKHFASLEFNSKTWSCIQINEGSSLGEPQVSAVANVFSQEGISLYYISTFANDYTLVPSDQFDKAVEVLKRRLGALVDP